MGLRLEKEEDDDERGEVLANKTLPQIKGPSAATARQASSFWFWSSGYLMLSRSAKPKGEEEEYVKSLLEEGESGMEVYCSPSLSSPAGA